MDLMYGRQSARVKSRVFHLSPNARLIAQSTICEGESGDWASTGPNIGYAFDHIPGTVIEYRPGEMTWPALCWWSPSVVWAVRTRVATRPLSRWAVARAVNPSHTFTPV